MHRNLTALSIPLSFAFLAACASPPPTTVATPPGPTIPPADKDTCRAASYASYLGRHFRDVPPAPAGRTFRFICTTCEMTDDFNAQRLNFFYDEATGRIVQLTCV